MDLETEPEIEWILLHTDWEAFWQRVLEEREP